MSFHASLGNPPIWRLIFFLNEEEHSIKIPVKLHPIRYTKNPCQKLGKNPIHFLKSTSASAHKKEATMASQKALLKCQARWLRLKEINTPPSRISQNATNC